MYSDEFKSKLCTHYNALKSKTSIIWKEYIIPKLKVSKVQSEEEIRKHKMLHAQKDTTTTKEHETAHAHVKYIEQQKVYR